jgi:hypothetical protein
MQAARAVPLEPPAALAASSCLGGESSAHPEAEAEGVTCALLDSRVYNTPIPAITFRRCTMRRLIIAAVGLVLVVGIVVGGLLGNPFDGKASAAPPKPTPTAQPVAEQNLDATGNIKVHEQGVANVNVVNSPPLHGGRLIELGTQTVGAGAVWEPIADVRDCTVIRAMAQGTLSTGMTLDNSSYVSPDGTNRMRLQNGVPGTEHTVVDGKYSAVGSPIAGYPFIQIRLANVGASPQDITAWLWCAW